MIPFLKKYCKQGGALPDPTNMRREVVPKVASDFRDNVFNKIADGVERSVGMTLNPDESTDSQDRSLINFILSFENESYLLETVFLQESLDHAELSRLTCSLMSKFKIEKNVKFFVTDNVEFAFFLLKILNCGI